MIFFFRILLWQVHLESKQHEEAHLGLHGWTFVIFFPHISSQVLGSGNPWNALKSRKSKVVVSQGFNVAGAGPWIKSPGDESMVVACNAGFAVLRFSYHQWWCRKGRLGNFFWEVLFVFFVEDFHCCFHPFCRKLDLYPSEIHGESWESKGQNPPLQCHPPLEVRA